jgi:hypothetical protein
MYHQQRANAAIAKPQQITHTLRVSVMLEACVSICSNAFPLLARSVSLPSKPV